MKSRLVRAISLLTICMMIITYVPIAYAATNPFPWGWCTWYAWQRAYEKWGADLPCRGNAQTWHTEAANAHWPVDSTPKADSIAVYTPGQWGHVAYVENVADNKIYISEMNGYAGWGNIDEGYYDLSTGYFVPTSPARNRYVASLPQYYIHVVSTVTFNANGGTGGPSSMKKVAGQVPAIPTNTPSRSGYAFVKWNSSPDGNGQYSLNPGDLWGGDFDITYYAIWKATNPVYTLTYNANGGINAPRSQKFMASTTLSTDQPTRDGYSFLGWSKNKSATTAEYTIGATYTGNSDVTLYAVWQANTYNITYNANGGSGAPNSQTKTHGVNLTISSTVPSRSGYEFLGWASSPDAIEATYLPGSVFTGNENTTLYAIWRANTYTIYFHAGFGTVEPTSKVVSYGSVYGELPIPVRDGHVFNGWYTEDKTQILEDSIVNITSSLNLFADWLACYTISYDANGGTGAPEDQTKIHGVGLELSSITPTREGYDFVGWSSSPNTTVASYQPGDVFSPNYGTTLYAIWAIKTYRISYDWGGFDIKTHDEDFIISRLLEWDGHTFMGWSINSDCSTIDYAIGSTYHENADIHLYPVWEHTKYLISFDANGGTNAPDPQVQYHGRDTTLSSVIPTRSNYTFIGWSTDKNATTAMYSAGGSYYHNGDATLYAVWELNTYRINFNSSGGIGGPSQQIKTHDIDLTISSDIPTRDGYTFLGWTAQFGTDQVDYLPGSTYSNNEAVTLHAVWNRDSIIWTITFDANGGQEDPESRTLTKGSTIQITGDEPVREGYTFLGWAYDPTAESPDYLPCDLCNDNEDIILYAVWTRTTFTISYELNGGTNGPSDQQKIYGEDLIVSPVRPTLQGYDFTGWYNYVPAYTLFQPGDQYTFESDATLYAQWSEHCYILTFDATGGTVSQTYALVCYNESYGKRQIENKLPVPNKNGYDFDGWFTAEDGGVKVTEATILDSEEDRTIYAHWSPVADDSVIASGSCGDNAFWKLDTDGTLTVYGSGDISTSSFIPQEHREKVKNIIIETGITGVGNYTFHGCSNLLTVQLPEGVTYIGGQAFEYCGELTSINIPASLKRIGAFAFAFCRKLNNLILPEDVSTTVFTRMYEDILIEITLPSTVEELQYGAFIEAVGVGQRINISIDFDIPEFVSTIDTEAFEGISATAVSVFTKWDRSLEVNSRAFANCKHLQYFWIMGDGPEELHIADDAFVGCNGTMTIISGFIEDSLAEQLEQYALEHGFQYLENEKYWGNG